MATESTVTLITGAASGIGAATARLLALPGRQLVLHTRSEAGASRDRLSAVAEQCRALGATVAMLSGDLSEAGCGAKLVEAVVQNTGRLDHLVANAGFSDKRPVTDLTRADLDRSYTAMTGAYFEMAKSAAPHLERSACGRVVLVSSFVAHKFAPGRTFPASAAAKAGAEALMRALAVELAPKGVTCNAVVPGYTRKDGGHSSISSDAWKAAAALSPMGRLGEPTDVAHLIRFLLSPDAGYITGQAIAVDGGLTLG